MIGDEKKLKRRFFPAQWLDNVIVSMKMTPDELLSVAEKDSQGIPETSVYSICSTDASFHLQSQPLTVATVLRGSVWQNPLWGLRSSVCISATLRMGGCFDTFIHKVGMTEQAAPVERICAPCLFDYPRQMILTIAPKHTDHHNMPGIDDIVPHIDRSKGACLLLFTARRRRDLVVEELRRRYGEARVLQAEEDVETVTRRLREDASSIVCGLRRYWTGLDVETLGLVVIDKLPFDPDFKPRKHLMTSMGMRGLWAESYMDRTNATLVQGIGRLIRNPDSVGREAYIRDSRARRPGSMNALRGAFPDVPIMDS